MDAETPTGRTPLTKAELTAKPTGGFAAIPNAIRQLPPAFKPIHRMVLCELAARMYHKGDTEAWPSMGTIAKAVGCLRPAVWRVLKELERAGVVAKRERTPSEYLASPGGHAYSITAKLFELAGGCSIIEQGGCSIIEHKEDSHDLKNTLNIETPLARANDGNALFERHREQADRIDALALALAAEWQPPYEIHQSQLVSRPYMFQSLNGTPEPAIQYALDALEAKLNDGERCENPGGWLAATARENEYQTVAAVSADAEPLPEPPF